MSALSSFDTSSSAASVLPAPPACPQRPRGVRHRKNRRDHSMSHHRFATGLSAVALVVLVAGCAGPNAGLYESDTGAAAPAPPSELRGAWHGTFGWVGANFYEDEARIDRKSTRLNSSHGYISYAVFCLKKKKKHVTEIVVYA